MIPIWPDELPSRALVDGYREALADGRLSTPMDAGPPKRRRRSSAVPRPLEISFRVDANQKARLERFYREDTGDGTLPFVIRDQVNHGRPIVADDDLILTDDTGRPLLIEAWWLVVFGDTPPTFTPRQRGLDFIAAFPLAILPTS